MSDDDLDTIPWSEGAPPPTLNGAKGRRCVRHDWSRLVGPDGTYIGCRRCGKVHEAEASRRGRNARARGNAYERTVAAILGGRRVGQYGDKVDVDVPGYLRVQVKNGPSYYPERLDGYLRSIPVEAGILRAVVIGDAPGHGRRRRALIVMDLDEYASWHGNVNPKDDPV